MKKNKFLIIALLYTLPILSQNTPQVINCSGLNLQNSKFLFDLSIGETVNTTITNNLSLTQGYLQPLNSLTNNVNAYNSLNLIKYYPNPFTNNIFIESSNTELYITLTDVTGKVILDRSTQRNLDLSFLVSGIYNLIAVDKDDNMLLITKIVKQAY